MAKHKKTNSLGEKTTQENSISKDPTENLKSPGLPLKKKKNSAKNINSSIGLSFVSLIFAEFLYSC